MAERRRIFAPPEAFSGGALLLEGERLRHLRTVLRLGPGEEFEVTDGAGGEFRARVERWGRTTGRAVILGREEPSRESALRVTLAQALPRGDRFALVLEKAVELGVSGVIPVLSRRTGPEGRRASEPRWRRIVESAVAQCGRTRLPVVHPARTFTELAGDSGIAELRILLWERSPAGLRPLLDAVTRPPRTVLLAVGPEGGWSDEEIREAGERGFAAARIGPRTLRTETAAIAGLGILQHRWGDLG